MNNFIATKIWGGGVKKMTMIHLECDRRHVPKIRMRSAQSEILIIWRSSLVLRNFIEHELFMLQI